MYAKKTTYCTFENANKKDYIEKYAESRKIWRGCPSLVGGRPAKSVVSNGRVGSNPTPRAIKSDKKITSNLNPF